MSWRSGEIRHVGMLSVVIRWCCEVSWWGLLQPDRVLRVGGRVVVIVGDQLFGGGAEKGVWVVMVCRSCCSRMALWAALRTSLVRRGARKLIEASTFKTMGTRLRLLGVSFLLRLAAVAERMRA